LRQEDLPVLTALLNILAVVTTAPALSNAKPDPACASVPMARLQQHVSVDGTKIAYVHCGSGKPTIVFEGGFGGDLENWKVIFPLVGKFAPEFAYSRPGFGGSTTPWLGDADGMRTSEESARLLHAALRAARIRPPYILVGHSLGGLYIQKFAQLFPKDTAGLVLMDNRPATFMKKCAAEGVPECAGQGHDISPDWSVALKSTFLGIAPSEAVAPAPVQLGRLPILVITAGKPEADVSQRFFDLFHPSQADYARQLMNGRQVIIREATHSSLSDAQAPQVVSEIKKFWSQLDR
jgi:pimeloyl-ACP methyl ester carboxylesterase